MTSRRDTPAPLLFLIGDTGGGHRSAATAVAQALTGAYPRRFAPLICDPLRGPGAPRRLRWGVALYGPNIRLAPWLWGVLWRMSGPPQALPWPRTPPRLPVVTVVTDLITTHLSWRDGAVDRIIVPSATVAGRCRQDGMPEERYAEIGLPVATEFCRMPASGPERYALQRSLGLRGH